MIEVGLIGFGVAGKAFHAPMIRAVTGLRLAAILQRTGSEVRQTYPDVHLVRNLEELLAITSIQLIVIATPPRSHFELAKQCLLAGRHVVVDKPFTTTCSEAKELIALAEENGRLLSVYHNRRWDGDFLTVRQLVSSGTLGRIVLLESRFDRYRPQPREGAWREQPQPGSGILFDLGPHLLDQALVLFGAPEAIAADVRVERDGALTDDAFDIVLHYPRMRAVLRAGSLVSTPTPRFSLEGVAGGYLKYGLDPQEEALRHGQVPGGNAWGHEPEENWGELFFLRENKLSHEKLPTSSGDYRKFYENMRDAILGHAAPSVTPQQALAVMQALELARESGQSSKPLPWPAAN
jgi:scyllo-inositol 2-dehydrogenase (NADP+)